MANRPYTDPFEVLGLPSSASKDEVKQAFRQLALRCHPDVDPSPLAAQRFTQVKRAADAILKGHYTAGAGPNTSYAAWPAYAASAARHAPDSHDWRPRSRHTAVWLCGLTLAAGFGIFYGALLSHEWLDGYRWLTPQVAADRLKHPTPRRQQLVALMLQQRAERKQAAAAAGSQGDAGGEQATGPD